MAAPPESARLPEPDDAIEELLGRAVLELEQRGEQGLQEFLARHATHAEAVRSGLERLRVLGILAPPPAVPVDRVRYGEFRVLHRLGTGGMGVVYAAEQTSLQRKVALKVVRPEFLLSKSARERFQREVEAIARLQHPGIVPILAVGNEDAGPWFAMEYVDGFTLEDLLASVRGKDPARVDGAMLRSRFGLAAGSGSASAVFGCAWWETCVRLVHQVATTMAYVHEQGIVHRDLKPSNIVVTKQGQALVLDFGLAHVRDLHRVTLENKPLGTPAYAAPEQVRGEAIDERVDVYGLGVTLYELLTTRLPFEQRSWEALSAAILQGAPQPVRRWNRTVPRDLEIVCAVAIDRDRARRYRSMAEFAQDLEAVLARHPIRARPLGPGLRLVRFAQRHRTWSIAAAALVLVGLQFPLFLWRQEARANDRLAAVNTELETSNSKLEKSNRELDRQRAIAVDTFTDALDAVRQTMVASAQQELQNTPGGEQTQLAILRRADEMYERLRKKRPGSRRVEFDSARNLQHIGRQLGRLGDLDGAERSFRAALERTASWGGADFDYLNGSIRHMLALALERRGAREEAAAAYERAWCELDSAMSQFPGDRVVRRALLGATTAWAAVRGRADRAEGERLLLAAQEHAEALYAELPWDQAGAIACATGCQRLAEHFSRRDPAMAEHYATRGIDIVSAQPPTGQEQGTMRGLLAALYDLRGVVREANGRWMEAGLDHGNAFAIRQGLVADFPSVVANRFDLGGSCNNLAMVQRHLESLPAALACYEDAIVHFREAVRMTPKRLEFVRGLSTSLGNRAELLLEMRDFDRAGAAIDELAASSSEPTTQLAVARISLKLARWLRGRGGERDAAAAARWRERALGCVEAAIAGGFGDRAHFESSTLAREYDDIREEDRFLDALDRTR